MNGVNTTMKMPGREVIGAILVAVMAIFALVLTAVFNDLKIPVLIVFIGTYILISTEKLNRTALSLLGLAIVGVVLFLGFEMGLGGGEDFEHLIVGIDWTTIIFVIAMSVIVSVSAASGLFQYIALRIAAPSGGDHKALFTTFLVVVAGISLFFDTVSTMLIAAPFTIEICKALEIDFKPFLVSEAIVCNFSSIPSEHRTDRVFSIDPATMIKDRWDFNVSVVAIVFLVIGFALGPTFGIVPPMTALIVASTMLLIAHERANEFLNRIGWPTVFFLVGLFGLVGALEVTGLIDDLALLVGDIIGDNSAFATVFLVWIPATLSAFLDNLPVSAVLAPIAQQYATLSPVLPLALVFAVNIGGYIFTPLGSPANMVVIGLSEIEHDPIPFIDFVKIGTLLGMIHLVIGSGYLLLVLFLMGG